MSARNSLQAKAHRRRARQVRHVGGCAICGDKDVVYVDEHAAPDASYPAICRRHLAYAVATIFGWAEQPSTIPGPQRRGVSRVPRRNDQTSNLVDVLYPPSPIPTTRLRTVRPSPQEA